MVTGLLILIISGFLIAYFFLRKNNTPDVLPVNKELTKDSVITKSLLKENFDFENFDGATNEKAASGKKSYKLTAAIEYGFGANKFIKDIPNYQNLKTIELDMKCWMKKKVDAVYVVSVEDAKGKSIYWESKPIDRGKNEEWCNLHCAYVLKPEAINAEYIIKIYPWNKTKKEFYIDDLVVDYKGTEMINSAVSTAQSSGTNYFYDFEKTDGLTGTESIKKTTAHSGIMACDLTGGREYGPLVIKKVGEISNTPFKKISTSVWVYPLTDKPNLVLTASITNEKNENLFWNGKSTETSPCPKNKWTKLNMSCDLPVDKITLESKIQVNVWNKGKTDLIVDDMEIVYGESTDRRGEASTIDANTIYEKKYVSQRNKPPFKTIYFVKQEINNGNSTCITADKNNPSADFSPNDEYLVGDFIKDKNNLDELVCIRNNKLTMFSYAPESKGFKLVWEGTNCLDSLKHKIGNTNLNNKSEFKSTDIIYDGNYYGDGKNEFLKLNTDWRFDLKLLEKDKDGYSILGNVDFKGYPNDNNPKYYEFVKIVAGKFIDSKKTSLIVMMRNCADDNFKGIHCNQFENLPSMPNSTQLYSLEDK